MGGALHFHTVSVRKVSTKSKCEVCIVRTSCSSSHETTSSLSLSTITKSLSDNGLISRGEVGVVDGVLEDPKRYPKTDCIVVVLYLRCS